jgi:hypothetical protein
MQLLGRRWNACSALHPLCDTCDVNPIAGLWTLQYLINKGQVSKDMEQSMYVTYLASQVCINSMRINGGRSVLSPPVHPSDQFRSLRFGLEEAHGRGHALQMNTFIDLGAYSYDQESGHWSVNFDRIQVGKGAAERKSHCVKREWLQAAAIA